MSTSSLLPNLKRRRGEGAFYVSRQHSQWNRPFFSVILGFSICIGLALFRLFFDDMTAIGSISHVNFTFPTHQMQFQQITSTDDKDADCIFRHSPIYRKVYVYPNPGEPEWQGDIVSPAGQNLSALQPWPWLELDKNARENSQGHYNIYSPNVQYTTELLVKELMVNPNSCLRTLDPEEASLFYVPYLPSIEHHVGHNSKTDYSFSPFGRAIIDILDKEDYNGWETIFGLTSKYWKRRKGSDHILVFSEPMHGLFHPRNRRGNYHFVHSQKQLAPPIVISVELSTAFVSMYPKCTAKNILVPYPNTHGDWYNGVYEKQALELLETANVTISSSNAALPAERLLSSNGHADARPVAQYYSAGNHGTCRKLRRAMQSDYMNCALSNKILKDTLKKPSYSVGMRLSSFCPAPGGDSPSAKRMFDALIAGCIPIILSEDFVWPFTKEFDPLLSLDPLDFSIRLNASDFDEALLDGNSCQPLDTSKKGLQAYLESLPVSELERLRRGAALAGKLFSWFAIDNQLPPNPLKERILPNGGTAFFVVNALAERAEGKRWNACEEELKRPRGPDPTQFKC
jgi:Exostosin family